MQKILLRLAAGALVTSLLSIAIGMAHAAMMSTEESTMPSPPGTACDTSGERRTLCDLEKKMMAEGEQVPADCAKESAQTLTNLGHVYCALLESAQQKKERMNLKGFKSRMLEKALTRRVKRGGQEGQEGDADTRGTPKRRMQKLHMQEKQERQQRKGTRRGIIQSETNGAGAQVLQSSEMNSEMEQAQQMQEFLKELKGIMQQEGTTSAAAPLDEPNNNAMRKAKRWLMPAAAMRVLEQKVRSSTRTLRERKRPNDESRRGGQK